ncbi:MAG: hypothetical protein ACOC41_00255 [Chitinivibrionales bacterium]
MRPTPKPSIPWFSVYLKTVCVTILGMLYLIVLNGSSCATVDPPPPQRLEAPLFTKSDISVLPVDDELREIIHLQWEKRSGSDISVIEYRIIRRIANDTISSEHSLPGRTLEFFDPADELDVDRLETQAIFYQIFSIDSLERSSDTSAVCTVSLAPLVRLLSPSDTLSENHFRWSIYNVTNPCVSQLYLYNDFRIHWQSGPVGGYQYIGSDREEQVSFSLPDSIYDSLNGAGFAWAVKLQVVGAKDPTSISTKTFFAGSD